MIDYENYEKKIKDKVKKTLNGEHTDSITDIINDMVRNIEDSMLQEILHKGSK